MKMNLKSVVIVFACSLLFISCADKAEKQPEQEAHGAQEQGHEEEGSEHSEEEGLVSLTAMQREAIGLELGTLQLKNLSGNVKATGELELPPEGKASISAIIGGNVYKINVIEGDRVQKGQTLALLENPDFVEMQVNLQAADSRLEYLEKDYQRQQNLYEQNVGSGKALQKAKADYLGAKSKVEGLKSKMKILGLNPQKIINGEVYRFIPVVSPINGFIEDVNINLGQYVAPQEMLFAVVDNSHIHADLMVFEEDVYKVKEGQTISFTVTNAPQQSYTGKIYAVGKTFEEDPKAVHVHAEIDGDAEALIPGMYIEGQINVDDMSVLALPEAAIVKEGEKSYIFVKTEAAEHSDENTEHTEENEKHEKEESWTFKMVPVATGNEEDGWVEVKLFEPLPDSVKVAYNGAYKLISEMNKSETSHSH